MSEFFYEPFLNDHWWDTYTCSAPSTSVQGQRAWAFGRRQRQAIPCLLSQNHSYALDLNAHSGVVVGLPWESVTSSLDRIAANAVQQGWQVILFDPLGTQAKADAFTSLVQQHTYKRTLVSRRYPATATLHASRTRVTPSYSSQLVRDRRNWRSVAPYADGVYFGFDAWQRPEQARHEAHALLSSLLESLSSHANEPRRVLVLMKHPDLLFEAQEIASLFSLFEEHGGRLFVAVRSVADFGKDAHRVLKNAQTLIIHRCQTSLPFEQYVVPTWWRKSDLKTCIRALPAGECFVLHRGACIRVRVFPVLRKHHFLFLKSVQHRHWNNEQQSLRETDEIDDEESDLVQQLASVFGPERTKEESDERIHSSPLWEALMVRSLRDQLRLLRALSLLGRIQR